jgi:4-diphosphocytidyl-2-C-methyl-D-erythritol kinase
LWTVAPDPAALRACALALGADVPVCLDNRPCRMQGIGEILTPLAALPATPLVLVNPGTPLDTGAVFRARTGAFSPPLERVPARLDAPADLATLVRAGGNDLEAPARRLLPAIGTVLDALGARPGCLAAAMSGSGATCFGLFASDETAALAAGYLGAAESGWWVAATRLRALASLTSV